MFLAKKSKGFCVEVGEYSTLLARLSSPEAPYVVEELKEFPSTDTAAVADWVKTTEGKGSTGYAHATCGVYPPKRIIRRHTLDLKKIKEPAYFSEIYTQQFRVEPEKYTIKVLNPDNGGDYDMTKATQKEALFCGLPSDDIIALQDKLLEHGVYPERLELGTLATLGGIANYLKFKQSKSPVLLLEIGEESTQSFILSADGVDISRPIFSGIAAMIPVVQKELGLKDEESAKKLFYSNTFDFTSMGGVLVKKLLKELQSSIGFYEVQTGQSISSVLCTQLPTSLTWLGTTMAGALGVPAMKMEMLPWLESLNIKLADGVAMSQPEERWVGLFSLIASYQNAVPDEKSDEPVVVPLWHTNFRNFERLPDTKVVRTTFFVNTAAGAVTVALLMWLGYGEYRLHNLTEQVAAAQREIDTNAKQNAEALRLTKVFTDEDKKLAEAEAFLKVPVPLSEYIELIGQTLPKEISIESANVQLPANEPKNQVYVLRGVVAGTRDQAAGTASSYVDVLRAHPRIGTIFDPITLDKLTPDGGTGFMSFEISLKVRTEAKK